MRVPEEPIYIDHYFGKIQFYLPAFDVSRGGTTWTGDLKMQGGKTGFCRKRWMQTGSSETLIGWKCGKTTFVPLYRTEWRERTMGPNGGSMAMDSVHVLPPLKIWNAERLKLDFAEKDKCKPVLLRISLAGNLEKPLMSLYGTRAGHC